MSEDLDGRWGAAVDRVEAAGDALHGAVDRVLDLMRSGREEFNGDRPLGEILPELVARGGVKARLAVTEATAEWERAMTAYRGVSALVLLDAGMTMTEVANLYGVTRPMISKLKLGLAVTGGDGESSEATPKEGSTGGVGGRSQA